MPRGLRPYRRSRSGRRRIRPERCTSGRRAAIASPAAGGRPRRYQGDAVRRRGRVFLTVRPRRSIVRQSVLNAALVGSCSRSSASVRSGRAVMRNTKRCSCSSLNVRRRNFVCFRGMTSPVSRRRCFTRSTHARLRAYFAATSLEDRPASQSRSTRVRKSIEYGAMAPPAEVPCEYYVQIGNALTI